MDRQALLKMILEYGNVRYEQGVTNYSPPFEPRIDLRQKVNAMADAMFKWANESEAEQQRQALALLEPLRDKLPDGLQDEVMAVFDALAEAIGK